MAEEFYIIPENPQYSIDDIRKLQNSDPVNAQTILNPLILRILENIAAVKGMIAAVKCEYVDEATIREIVNGTYVPGEHGDDTAEEADVQEIIDDMYVVPAPPVEDDGDSETASGKDLQEILDNLYPA